MTALPVLFGSVPQSVVACEKDGKLREIAITYLDAGEFFGFQFGGEKTHADREAGDEHFRRAAKNDPEAFPAPTRLDDETFTARLKQAVGERSYLLAISGIVVLAVAVNLIELLCSAGIPAVYTQVLALSELQPAAYYGYLTLYIAVFLLDDAIVFVTAMVTLRAAGLAATYVRYSHLIGGFVLGGIGILLLLRPDLLAFV